MSEQKLPTGFEDLPVDNLIWDDPVLNEWAKLCGDYERALMAEIRRAVRAPLIKRDVSDDE